MDIQEAIRNPVVLASLGGGVLVVFLLTRQKSTTPASTFVGQPATNPAALAAENTQGLSQLQQSLQDVAGLQSALYGFQQQQYQQPIAATQQQPTPSAVVPMPMPSAPSWVSASTIPAAPSADSPILTDATLAALPSPTAIGTFQVPGYGYAEVSQQDVQQRGGIPALIAQIAQNEAVNKPKTGGGGGLLQTAHNHYGALQSIQYTNSRRIIPSFRPPIRKLQKEQYLYMAGVADNG